MHLKDRFLQLTSAHELPESEATKAWEELHAYYTHPKRQYHNLAHLENLFTWADRYATHLRAPDTVIWAIWYHDIIYNARRRDNEEQSARLAKVRLTAFGLAEATIDQVMRYIRATSQHLSVEATEDLAWFLDFDLAILGSEHTDYENYAASVRKEYAHVPGFLYKRGRKKVLRYFLDCDRLYRTEALYELLEERARDNLRWELAR